MKFLALIKRCIRLRHSRFFPFQINKLNSSSLQLFVIGLSSFCLAALLAWLASLDQVFVLFGFQLIASFGASIAIIIGLPESKSARVKNIIFGSLLSALIGVIVVQYLSHVLWLNVATAISLSIVLMSVTDLFHPPGGAIALITVSEAKEIQELSISSTLIANINWCVFNCRFCIPLS